MGGHSGCGRFESVFQFPCSNRFLWLGATIRRLADTQDWPQLKRRLAAMVLMGMFDIGIGED